MTTGRINQVASSSILGFAMVFCVWLFALHCISGVFFAFQGESQTDRQDKDRADF